MWPAVEVAVGVSPIGRDRECRYCPESGEHSQPKGYVAREPTLSIPVPDGEAGDDDEQSEAIHLTSRRLRVGGAQKSLLPQARRAPRAPSCPPHSSSVRTAFAPHLSARGCCDRPRRRRTHLNRTRPLPTSFAWLSVVNPVRSASGALHGLSQQGGVSTPTCGSTATTHT